MISRTTDRAERFRDAIAARLGLHFDDRRLSDLATLLDRRLEASGWCEEDYLARLTEDPDLAEPGALAAKLTVPETYFFRHLEQFQAFRETVLPAFLHGAKRRQLRILSAGCASGEEAYSIAILLREMALAPSWTVSIEAVDLNPVALKRAAAGRFSAWSLRETPDDLRARWFMPAGGDFMIDDEIRRAVRFEQRNLADLEDILWQPARYDIIFCRNAVMYLTADKMRQVVNSIERALGPGGYLFMGHAETLRGLNDRFELCQSHGAFYYRKASTKSAHKASSAMHDPMHPAAEGHPEPGPQPVDWMEAIGKSAQQIERLAGLTPAQAAIPSSCPIARLIRTVQGLLLEERFGDALELVEPALAASPENPQLRLFHVVLLLHCGQIEEAEAAASDLARGGHGSADAHHVLALCRQRANDLDSARRHDHAAAFADPSFAMPHLHLGLLARSTGKPAEMRRELAQAQLLLRREDAARLALFGGGFARQALIDLCASTLSAESGAR